MRGGGLGGIPRSHPTGTIAINKLKAAYHTLEFLAKDLKFTGVVGMEVTERTAQGLRFVDIKVLEGGRFVRYELKNATTFGFGAEVVKDIAEVRRAITSRGDEVTPATIRTELGLTVRWVFRGTREESSAVVTKLVAKLKELVEADGAAHVIDELKDTIIRYANRPLPI